MGETILYETTVEADDNDGNFLLKTKIPASPQDMLALYSDDSQASNAVTIKVISLARAEILQIRPWNCSVCHSRPATIILGTTVRLERPGGYEPSAKIIDDRTLPVCDEPSCVSRTRRRCKQSRKQLAEAHWTPLSVCNWCGKEESVVGPKMKRCGQCKSTWYCSGSCQKAEWPLHKKYCSKLEKCGGK